MSHQGGEDDPEWFRRALAAPVAERDISVEGRRISYRVWGGGPPEVLLVHGGAAHSHWWDHIAPWLVTAGRSIVALDLSGHGHSDWRPGYTLEGWATEMVAVSEAAGAEEPVVLAGHSLGGWATSVAAAEHPASVAGLILMDSRVVDPPADAAGPGNAPPAWEGPAPNRPARIYATSEEIIARYRPQPPQPSSLPFVVEHLARHSIRPVAGGWTWRFDGDVLGRTRPGTAALGRIACPVAIIRGQHGLVTPDITEEMVRATGGATPVIELPDAGHHLMLDQPLALVAAIRSVLAFWRAPGGRPG